MRNLRTRIIAGAAVAALALAACGGDDDTETSDETTTTEAEETTTTEEETTTTEAEETTTTAAEVDAEITAAGTELAIGDSAVVPYGDSEAGLVEITVTEIVAGDKAAFDAAFGENAEGIDPFYIRYTVELISIDPDDRVDVPSLRGTSADGGATGTVIVGDLEDCERERFESDAEVGATVETCRLQGAASGEVVAGAEYDEHDDYTDAPVLWLG